MIALGLCGEENMHKMLGILTLIMFTNADSWDKQDLHKFWGHQNQKLKQLSAVSTPSEKSIFQCMFLKDQHENYFNFWPSEVA